MEFGITLYEALVSANVAGDKAKAVVTVMEKEMFERLATKQELQAVESRLKEQIAFQLANLESRMTVKMGAMIAGSAGLFFGLLKFVPH